MIKKAFIALGLLFLAAPLTSFAATVSVSAVAPGAAASPLAACPLFNRSLSVGVSGSDVVALQEFLAGQGYFNAQATGYFGPITQSAVAHWQAQGGVVSIGGAGSGMFGPLSRAYFAHTCGGSGAGGTSIAPTSTGFSANPLLGAAPLTVQFISTAPQGSTVGNSVNFGDGTSGSLGFVPVCSSCNLEGVVSHTYTSPGTYTASLTSGACSCPANGVCNCPNLQILATTTITVGTASAAPQIEQINAPASVTLGTNDIAEVRNESVYFTLTSVTPSSATIALTPVGCWNSFPSDPKPQVVCMLAMLPIAPQTLSIGQPYTAQNYSITLINILNGEATFSVSAL